MLAWCGVPGELEGRLDSTAYQQVLEEHILTDAVALIEDNFVLSALTTYLFWLRQMADCICK